MIRLAPLVPLGLAFAASLPGQGQLAHLFTIAREVRTIDGTNNNPYGSTLGAAGIPLVRNTTIDYQDGAWVPSGGDRPGARAISNIVVAQPGPIPNSASVSDFVWQWGQFLDHDIDLTSGATPAEPFHIPIPMGDAWFDPHATGTAEMPLNRSIYTMTTGVREQLNEITAFIDASNVYGSDTARAAELRALDGTGRLRTSVGNLLPFNTNGFPNAPDSSSRFFLGGDVRANEQVGLTAMHTLFMREHNFWANIANRILSALPGRSWLAIPVRIRDDILYEFARAIVGAEMQAITYNEFLPVLLGPNSLPRYRGYVDRVDPGITNVFSTASYRFGHSMLSPVLRRIDASGATIPAGDLSLAAAFFNPETILAEGIDPILRGLAIQPAQEVDAFLVDEVRNLLFGPPGSGGFDLASLNIQRGRDHGLPGYNQVRRDLGLAAVQSFAEISSNPDVQTRLASAYGDVDRIDPWVGGLAEDHVPGALVGELVHTVLTRQFTALRDGDRFWYQNYLDPFMQFVVERQTLAVIIRRNTNIGSELSPDVFRVN